METMNASQQIFTWTVLPSCRYPHELVCKFSGSQHRELSNSQKKLTVSTLIKIWIHTFIAWCTVSWIINMKYVMRMHIKDSFLIKIYLANIHNETRNIFLKIHAIPQETRNI